MNTRELHKDDISNDPEHLKWLVKGRAANQRATLKLFLVVKTHAEIIKKSKVVLKKVHAVTSAGFSLWRAVFLADKTGRVPEVVDDVTYFLGKVLTDNAINFAQDRGAREWTFNYYLSNANAALKEVSADWITVESVLSDFGRFKESGTRKPSRRWNRHQKAFETAIRCLEKELKQRQKTRVWH